MKIDYRTISQLKNVFENTFRFSLQTEIYKKKLCFVKAENKNLYNYESYFLL